MWKRSLWFNSTWEAPSRCLESWGRPKGRWRRAAFSRAPTPMGAALAHNPHCWGPGSPNPVVASKPSLLSQRAQPLRAPPSARWPHCSESPAPQSWRWWPQCGDHLVTPSQSPPSDSDKHFSGGLPKHASALPAGHHICFPADHPHHSGLLQACLPAACEP